MTSLAAAAELRSFAPEDRPPLAQGDVADSIYSERERRYTAGDIIEQEGVDRPRARIVLSGWVGCCRSLSDGRRQIIRILVAGDVCGLPQLGPEPSRTTTVALSPVRMVEYGGITDVLRSKNPRDRQLASIISAAALRDQKAILDHIVRLGRMPAAERMAHLILELYSRAPRAGVAHGATILFPLTQEMLGDHLGLSIVHINRTLQQLRRGGLIELRAGRLTLKDPERLAALAGLDASAEYRVALAAPAGRTAVPKVHLRGAEPLRG